MYRYSGEIMIYSCSMFLNENDVLEIKINNHWDRVDKFIIVEASQTHTGDSKPYNFDRERFKKYESKLVYLQIGNLDDLAKEEPDLVCPALTQAHAMNPNENTPDWIRDSVHIGKVIRLAEEHGARDDDILIVDGCDEIINSSAFDYVEDIFAAKKTFRPMTNGSININPTIWLDPLFGFEVYNYYYKINLRPKGSGKITLSMATTLRNLKIIPVATLRHFSICTHLPVPNSGWHFGFLDNGDGDLALQKFKSWAHSKDKNTDYYSTVNTKSEAIDRIFTNFSMSVVKVEEGTHPRWLVDNLDKFDYLLYKPALFRDTPFNQDISTEG